MRINKFLAESGIASRRASDKLIEDGVVKINGKIAKLGDEVDPISDSVPHDKICPGRQKAPEKGLYPLV